MIPAEQPDRAGKQGQQQLNQSGGAQANRADRYGPVGLPPLVGVITAVSERERFGRVTLADGVMVRLPYALEIHQLYNSLVI